VYFVFFFRHILWNFSGFNQESSVATMSKRRITSSGLSLLGNPSTGFEGKAVPKLPEARGMNLTDIMIWKKFTRNLRQRVVERKKEKRTFCWVSRS